MKDRSTGMQMGRTLTSLLGLILLTVGLFASSTWAAEPVKINSLQTYPEAYKMKVVQVEGAVSGYHMDHFIGNNTKLEKCIQNFMVDDGTGTIQASYAALCQMGPVMLKDGDLVTIEGHYLGTLDVKSVRKN
jgi:DNA/RNA endonuclease YhcR with UshA esterase domain